MLLDNPLKKMFSLQWRGDREMSLSYPVAIILLICVFHSATAAEPAEVKLRKDLFQNPSHNALMRPVMSPTDVMNVSFGIIMKMLVHVSNKEQLMTTDVWVEQAWQNPLLTWNKSEYGGLGRIYVKPTEVWVPDTSLYNNGNSRMVLAGHVTMFKTFVILYSNGTNIWMAPATFVSTCSIDVTSFPFDSQSCQLAFGSWSMDAKDLDIFPLHVKQNHADSIATGGDWEIKRVTFQKTIKRYGCCPIPYATLEYTLEIQRKPIFHGLFLILPCLIIGGLILVTFFLPPENGERLGLCSTILLAVSVYLLILTELLPEKSDTLPLIGVYFIFTMVEISFVVVATIFVLKAYHATSQPPRFLQIFALRLKKEKDYKDTKPNAIGVKTYTKASDEEELQVELPEIEISGSRSSDVLARVFEEEKEENKRKEIWRDISIAFDRLFFWIFAAVFVVSTLTVYFFGL